MKYTELKMHEAVNLAVADTELNVYMLQPITKDTTLEMLSKAGGFVLATPVELPKAPEIPEEIPEEPKEAPKDPEPAKEEPKPVPKGEAVIKKTVKPVAKSGAKKEVDHAKIVALYTAKPPRSVSWIADEIGCSPQTVINHLEKEGIYKKRGDADDAGAEG